MTVEQLVAKCNELGIPLNWEIKLDIPNEYVHSKGIHVMGQGEIGIVFEDHQRLKFLEEDPEEYEIPVAN